MTNQQDIIELTEEEAAMGLPEWSDIFEDMQLGDGENAVRNRQRRSSTPVDTTARDAPQASGEKPGPSRPTNFRLSGEREESFKTLRKLLYKRHLAQHYEAELTKGIQLSKPLIKLQKPDMNLVEYTKIPANFENNIQKILQQAEMSINKEVIEHYKQLVPKLDEE